MLLLLREEHCRLTELSLELLLLERCHAFTLVLGHHADCEDRVGDFTFALFDTDWDARHRSALHDPQRRLHLLPVGLRHSLACRDFIFVELAIGRRLVVIIIGLETDPDRPYLLFICERVLFVPSHKHLVVHQKLQKDEQNVKEAEDCDCQGDPAETAWVFSVGNQNIHVDLKRFIDALLAQSLTVLQ